MNLSSILTQCRQIQGVDFALLCLYFDAITLVDTVAQFWQITAQFLTTNADHPDWHTLNNALTNISTAAKTTAKTATPLTYSARVSTYQTPPFDNNFSTSLDYYPLDHQPLDGDFAAPTDHLQPTHDFGDELYQALARNCWQTPNSALHTPINTDKLYIAQNTWQIILDAIEYDYH